MSVVVVDLYVGEDTDEASIVRSGLRAFRAVRAVVPVRGNPTDVQALAAIARTDVQRRNDELERENAQLRLRLERVLDATTAELPATEPMGLPR